jgi:acetyl esterase
VGRWQDKLPNRQQVRRAALDAGIHALAGVADLLPRMRQRRATFRLFEDVEYAHHGGQSLRLDIMQPLTAGPHPVLIYLHGGGFTIGSKRTHRGLAAAYASQGYVVCTVDYRLAPRHLFPAALQDACAAWLWAVDHVAAYNGDAQRMVLAGESAGANLALAVTLACCTERTEAFAAPLHARGLRPAATMLYCGFLQTSEPEHYVRAGASELTAGFAASAARAYLGPAAARPGPQHALADPLCIVEAMRAPSPLPPIFIAVGLADPVLVDSQRMDRALQHLGSLCSAHYYPGEVHAFHVMFWRARAKQCWQESFAFLQENAPVHCA